MVCIDLVEREARRCQADPDLPLGSHVQRCRAVPVPVLL